MNFIALIGIVEKHDQKTKEIKLKVDAKNKDDYILINCVYTKEFKNSLDITTYGRIKKDNIVGIKGRLNEKGQVITERIEIF